MIFFILTIQMMKKHLYSFSLPVCLVVIHIGHQECGVGGWPVRI